MRGTQRFKAQLDVVVPVRVPADVVIATSKSPAIATATSLSGGFDVHGVGTGVTNFDLKSGTEVGWESIGVVEIQVRWRWQGASSASRARSTPGRRRSR